MRLPARFVAVDTETTGLDFENERLVEIAAVIFEAGRPAAEFQALLSPGKPLTAVSRLLTGFSDEELKAAPPPAEALRAFLAFAGDLPLVAHNAEFDATFLRRALEREGLAPLPGPWLDSLLIARTAWPEWESHRLDSLAERLEFSRDAEHRALPDARRCGEVFVAAVETLRASVSPEGKAALARLAAGLPDWSLVFSDPGSEPSVSSPAAAGAPVPAGAVRNTEATPADAEIDRAAAEALGKEAWLTLETPPAIDDAHAGFRIALQAAARGQRVLLCLPDAFSWNALRKSADFRSAGSKACALPEPAGFLCRARLAALADNPILLPAEERAAVLPLVAWADRNPSGPAADCRGFSPERSRLTWSRVCCDVYSDDPAAVAARAAAGSAGVILIPHAALCAHLQSEGALLPACDSVVVAGAHRLPETVQRALGREVSLFRLQRILQLLRRSPEEDAGLWSALGESAADPEVAPWKDRWFEPERLFQKFLQKAGKQAAKRRPQGDSRVRYAEPVSAAFAADPDPVLAALREQEAFLEEAGKASAAPVEFARVADRLRTFRLDFEALCEAADADEVFWFDDVANPHKAALRSVPLDPEAACGSRLRELFGAGVFLSPALMQGNGNADYFLRTIGMAEAGVRMRRVRGAEPAPPFFLAPFTPVLATAESAEGFARFLAETAGPFSDRGIFVLFPSQSSLRAVGRALRAVLPAGVPVCVEHVDGHKDAVARLYASGHGGFVLATEGFPGLRDAEGRAPALAVIARMPLPPTHDPILEARGERLRELGKNPRHELWHAAAILRLKRDWAGLARAGNGPRVLWLLDARASAEGLGAQAARALGCDPRTFPNAEALCGATTAVFGAELPDAA